MEKKEIDFGKNPDGLVPAIIQDVDTKKVLMLGYMDKAAYEKTLDSGLVTFWSRSRKKEIFVDCDSDTLLIYARPDGPTCHRGTISCFDTPDEEGFLGRLQQVIRGRHEEMPEGHYTTRLFSSGVAKISQKVGEEAVETILEAMRGDLDRYIYEASDLLYHLLVLNEQMGIGIADLEKELLSRHK